MVCGAFSYILKEWQCNFLLLKKKIIFQNQTHTYCCQINALDAQGENEYQVEFYLFIFFVK
jgi:hypothetical protein